MFQNKDLLKKSEITELINTLSVQDRASIITKKLINYCFINDDKLYIMNPNVTYTMHNDLQNGIIDMASKLIDISFKNLSDEKTEYITKIYPKYSKIFKNSFIVECLPQIKSMLNKNDIVFNVTIEEIHFQNGFMNTRTAIFGPRIMHKHYVTNYIKRDYVQSSEAQRKTVMMIIRKIYPEVDDLEYVLYYLASALSWNISNQCLLFLLGFASSGKSFIMSLCKATLECYVLELQSDALCESNNNINKILNTYQSNPQALISWINELAEGKKLNASLLKLMVDGFLQTTKLYCDNQFNFTHHSKLTFTSNNRPTFILDSGVIRRIRCLEHFSIFTSEKNLVDESKNVYLLDKDIILHMTQNGLLNAFFDILVSYCVKFIGGYQPPESKNLIELKEEIIGSNDIFADFIDSRLDVTNDQNDRLGKAEMCEMFKSMYPQKHLSESQILNSMKEKKIAYNFKLTKFGVKGCYTGVKFKDICDDQNAYDNNEKNLFAKVQNDEKITKLTTENELLQKKYDDLLQLQKVQSVKTTINKDEINKQLVKELKERKVNEIEREMIIKYKELKKENDELKKQNEELKKPIVKIARKELNVELIEKLYSKHQQMKKDRIDLDFENTENVKVKYVEEYHEEQYEPEYLALQDLMNDCCEDFSFFK
jgi:hypothetical protein